MKNKFKSIMVTSDTFKKFKRMSKLMRKREKINAKEYQVADVVICNALSKELLLKKNRAEVNDE